MILPNLKDKNIILGSGSPRRKNLLEGLHLEFSIITKDVEEIYSSDLKREEVARYLSELKAAAFENELENNDILITSDTTVYLNGEILNKPKSAEEAAEMLKKLSGETHTVITAVSISSVEKQVTFHDETNVTFLDLTDDEIQFYVDTHKPFDKAGAYGAQEFLGFIGIEKLEGSYFNVMGLPVHDLWQELKNW